MVGLFSQKSHKSRPTQSMIYVPLLVNRLQKSVELIIQYQILKPCSGEFILQNLIPCTRSCGTGFITEPSWLVHFQPTKMVGRKCFVPLRYQLRRGSSGGPALKSFYMIHRVGWIGLFFGKSLIKIRHPICFHHAVSSSCMSLHFMILECGPRIQECGFR